MALQKSVEYIKLENSDKSIEYTFYLNSEVEHLANIIYLHGGGFIAGRSDDLPAKYIEMLTAAGFRIYALNYLLAPKYRIDEIIDQVELQVRQFLYKETAENFTTDRPFFLFGRSAGAYLSLNLGYKLSNSINGIISFYGYYNFQDAVFAYPSRHYLAQSKVEPAIYQSLINKQPLSTNDQSSRLLIYLYTRQTGTWLNLLSKDKPEIFSKIKLSEKELNNLPPTFLTCADKDPDVPVRQTKMMSRMIPVNELHMVRSREHDFDRVELETIGVDIYQKLISWILRNL